MIEINTSGPVFATDLNNHIPGMTLRDYFAAKAISGLMVGEDNPDFVLLADMSYQVADAMLKSRGEK